ncbi:MAG: glycosyltransferase [Myxococcales bacterium]|nr:glycosyltransferase [Myxococcales bacterium]
MASDNSGKICVFAPVHPYWDIRVFQKEAKSLAAAGFDVTLLAQAESDREDSGVHVKALQKPKNRLHRFALQPVYAAEVLRTGAKVVHMHNPDTLLVGLVLKAFGRKVVYDTHEDFAKLILTKTWLPKPARSTVAKLVDAMERGIGTILDAVVVTQRGQTDIGRRNVLIENPPIASGPLIDEALSRAAKHEQEREPGVLRVVFVGRISEDRGLLEMLGALAKVNEKKPARMWLIGAPSKGDEAALERWKQHPGWQYVDFFGQLPQAEAFSYIGAADVGMITFLDRADYKTINPNKLFEYMRFGTPFIASDFPTWRSYLTEADNVGHFVDPSNVDAIAKAMLWFAEKPEDARAMGERAQKFILERYNWELESEKLISLHASLS